MKVTLGTVLAGASATLVIGAIVAGFVVVGSPSEERARRTDRRRVADLQGIAAATDLYWTRHSRLPASLGDLTAEPGVTISTNDPVTAERYGYEPLDSTSYELCAAFQRESQATRGQTRSVWAHGAGRHCFRLAAEEITREGVESQRAPAAGGRPSRPS